MLKYWNIKKTIYLRMMKKAVLGLALFLLAIIPFSPVTVKALSVEAEEIKSDCILVKYKGIDKIASVMLKAEDDPETVLETYRNKNEVEYAEPNHIYKASILPSDTHFIKQWYLKKIKAVEAWDTVRESPEIKIAILDSGVQINHPDLRDNIWRNTKEIAGNGIDDDKNGYVDDINGWDFITDTPDPNPKFDDGYTLDGIMHGTIVAGVVAAQGNNAAGISGVTWKAKIMPLRVLDSKGEGDTRSVIRAIDYAVAQGADIINLSFVGFGYSRSMDAAIRKAYEAGVVVVAAGGNEGQNGENHDLDETPMYPVCHDGGYGENMVIGVAATDALDQKAAFSGFGYKCIDISAPGISIFSTVIYSPEHKYAGNPFDKHYDGYWAGTSMAVPMVSGAVALIKTVNPRLSRSEIVDILKETSHNIYQLNPDFLGQLGRGRLDVEAAVNAAKKKIEDRQIKLLFSPLSEAKSIVKIADANGFLSHDFMPYNESFRGGINLSSCDVDGDGIAEIITGTGPGGGPHVRIFDHNGNLKGQFFAYNESFRGGVNLACGDVDGDGIAEIITGAGSGGGPQVRIFSDNGNLEGQFFAYDKNFRGGVNVAVADVDRGSIIRKAEIITSPGKGGGPQIRIFNNHAALVSQFFAYGDNMRSGISIAGGDIDNDGLDEIITGAGPGGTPHVRVFKKDGNLLKSFFAFDQNFSGGVSVGAVMTHR